jgi:hypothetical protein
MPVSQLKEEEEEEEEAIGAEDGSDGAFAVGPRWSSSWELRLCCPQEEHAEWRGRCAEWRRKLLTHQERKALGRADATDASF